MLPSLKVIWNPARIVLQYTISREGEVKGRSIIMRIKYCKERKSFSRCTVTTIWQIRLQCHLIISIYGLHQLKLYSFEVEEECTSTSLSSFFSISWWLSLFETFITVKEIVGFGYICNAQDYCDHVWGKNKEYSLHLIEEWWKELDDCEQ